MERRSFFKQIFVFTLSLSSAVLVASCSSTPTDSDTTETASTPAEVEEINFGIISTESQANQKPVWEPFIEAMSEEIGIPVNAFYATQYAGVIEGMRAGKVQVAWYGGKSYVEAAKRADAEVFSQVINADGTKGYYSYLITNKDNPIVAQAKAMGGDKYVVENAKDLTFAFNDPNSTSGFLVPSFYVFAKNGVNPKQAFKRLVFAGNHEATALAVANNQVDVATNNSEAVDRLEKTNPEAREKIEVIWTSTLIPSDPIAYRKDLPADLKEKIQEFFYNYQDESVLQPLEWQGFAPVDDSTWDPIRELDVGKKILEVESNENLSPEDKQKKLEELNKELEAIKN